MKIFSIKINSKKLFIAIIILICIGLFTHFLLPRIRLHRIGAEEERAAVNLPPPSPAEADDILSAAAVGTEEKKYIKWVDFKVSYAAMEKAMKADIDSHSTENPIDWVDILSYLGAKYGGEFSRYKEKDITDFLTKIQNGETVASITEGMKYFPYYREAYGAVLDEFIGDYSIEISGSENPDEQVFENRYGLKVFSPIANGYGYSDYDDFGVSRTYGYKRRHLGHDMMGSVGTPIIAVESGVVEALGWNMYGGWRIGIRSFDQKRYYYYAHLRRNHPYNMTLKEGDKVCAGDVIGYLGMTGYSTKENVNNIDTPHLHIGLQLIFDESQKDGVNQIWIDLYDIVRLLRKNKSSVYKNTETNEYFRKYQFYEPMLDTVSGQGD